MARLSIYVPDDKKPEIEQAKGKLNLSQIFVEAFDAAVAKLAQAPPLGDSEMHELIDRLKKQHRRDFADGWKAGLHIANNMAQNKLRIGDFRRISSGSLRFGRDMRCKDWINDTFHNQSQEERWLADEEDYSEWKLLVQFNHTDLETYFDGMDAGFTERVTAIWEQIEPHLQDGEGGEPA